MKCECGWKGQLQSLDYHKEKFCLLKQVDCPWECGSVIPRNCIKKHISSECSKRLVQCSFARYGCSFFGVPLQICNHQDSSLSEHLAILLKSNENLASKALALNESARTFEEKLGQELFMKEFGTVLTRLEGKSRTQLELALKYCRNLEDIDLSGVATTMNDDIFSHILNNCCSKNLKWISIAGCVSLTEKSLLALEQFHLNLEHLNLKGCSNFRITSLNKVLSHFWKLDYLNLWNTHVTDETATILAKNCRKLTVLNLNGCSNISLDSIRNIVTELPLLDHLHLLNGCQIAKTEEELFSQINRNLKISH